MNTLGQSGHFSQQRISGHVCTHTLCPTLSQTLNSSQVTAQIAGASPASGVPRDPACESVHCHSAPCVSSAERGGVFPQGIKWMVFLIEGFLRLSFYTTNGGKENVMMCVHLEHPDAKDLLASLKRPLSGEVIFYGWRQGHEEMVESYGNSPESTTHSLMDPDLGLKKCFCGFALSVSRHQPCVVNRDSNISRNRYDVVSCVTELDFLVVNASFRSHKIQVTE